MAILRIASIDSVGADAMPNHVGYPRALLLTKREQRAHRETNEFQTRPSSKLSSSKKMRVRPSATSASDSRISA